MIKVSKIISVILITFLLGIVGFFYWSIYLKSKQTDRNENCLPTAGFCDLVNNPKASDGKIIKLLAGIKIGNHGEYIYSSDCPADENIKTYYDATAAIIYKNPEDQKKVKDYRDSRRNKKWTEPVNVSIKGKFKINFPSGKSSDLRENSTFHFEVTDLDILVEELQK